MRIGTSKSRDNGAIIGQIAGLAVVWLLLTPAATTAHVTRTAGPYTILVVLVEEPVFQDNHAGFQFWVRRDGVAVKGLERTIRAEATGHGADVELRLAPLDSEGFYVLDTTLQGARFDPRGGGAWSLRLHGTINGLKFDLVFPVLFPGYPRVAVQSSSGLAGASAPAQGPPMAPIWLIGATAGLVVLAGLGARRLRRGGAGTAAT